MGERLFDQQVANSVVNRCIPPSMIVGTQSRARSERISLLEQTSVVSSDVVLALEEEIMKLVKDYKEMEDLAKHTLQRIEML